MLIGAFHPSNPARGPGGWYKIDLSSKAVTRVSTLDASLHECEFLFRRNVHGTWTGKGKWNLGIDIPEDKGMRFLLAVGSSGVRPGIPLPDGRALSLNFDTFMALSIRGGIPPFIPNTAGILDSQGEATVKVDFSSLPRAANGVVLHFVAVTLDAAAPLGIRTITDPLVFTIEGL